MLETILESIWTLLSAVWAFLSAIVSVVVILYVTGAVGMAFCYVMESIAERRNREHDEREECEERARRGQSAAR